MDRILVKYKRLVKKINVLATETEALRDQDFMTKTNLIKMQIKSGESLDQVLVPAFALVREAAKRTVGLWAYDVQLLGAIAVHEGKIAEMKTGEGKTLTILFAAYLNALSGKGVHVVTANDYLAERDGIWASRVFKFVGLSTGFVTSQTVDFDRQIAYAADVTYLTNNEVCFDYLKDNIVYEKINRRQRDLHYAIIDEADSVLIDEAQTPLVISENMTVEEQEKALFARLNETVSLLERKTDFAVDQKSQTVSLTIEGIKKLERLLDVSNLYGDTNEDYLYYIERLLKAHYLFEKDKDYIIDNGQVVIVDEFTGRLMPAHRYFQGIHQAIEAKEKVTVNDETKTMAATTFQNFFNQYEKIAGLTGTALTAEKEFRMVYKKEVVVIPPNRRVIRNDQRDLFFLRWEDKLRYLGWSTQEYFFKEQPVLIGTRSVEKSQQVQKTLVSDNIPCNVLNAKHTRREAEVVAQAGQPQTVTVATNMAGRGTDIDLADPVREKGGLIIFGTERHNTRRIDNQLIGRAGRQGDPGLTQFLISADDELIRIHFKEQYEKEFAKYKDPSRGVQTKRLEALVTRAQKRFEGIFFDQRILTYEFDKVLQLQREAFYRQRYRVLHDEDLKQETLTLIKHEIYQLILQIKDRKKKHVSSAELQTIRDTIMGWVSNNWLKIDFTIKQEVLFLSALESFYASVVAYYQDFENYISPARMRTIETVTTLKVLDLLWAEHLETVEQLQDAALVSSITNNNFFEDYEMQMAKAFRAMLASVPRIVCQTMFRTINRIWQMEMQNRM